MMKMEASVGASQTNGASGLVGASAVVHVHISDGSDVLLTPTAHTHTQPQPAAHTEVALMAGSSAMPAPSRGEINVLYASATGTAADMAESLGRVLARRGFHVRVCALSDTDTDTLPSMGLAVYVVSTCGDGDMPANGTSFWRFLLRRDLPVGALAEHRFTVFGLGDSRYIKFNAAARKLHTRLLQLGGMELCERGLGDEQSRMGVFGDFDTWSSAHLFPALDALRPAPAGLHISTEPQLVACRYRVRKVAGPGGHASVAERGATLAALNPTGSPDPSTAALTPCKVVECKRITAPDWSQDVRHIELDVESTGLRYAAGDVAVLFPENTGDGGVAVRAVAERLGIALDDQIEIVASGADAIDLTEDAYAVPTWLASKAALHPFTPLRPWPRRTTVRELLTCYLDICGIPRRSFLEQISFFATDEEHREKLMEMSQAAGADLYHMYCNQERRSYADVLAEFTSIRVPLPYLLELIPPLQPREFSIASAPEGSRTLQLCIAIVDYKTKYGRRIRGLCSSWITQWKLGDEVLCRVHPGTIRWPSVPEGHAEPPVILVGPGTGIAPMRSLLMQRRARQKASPRAVHESDTASPSTSLFFGCRHRAKDWLYGEELSAWSQDAHHVPEVYECAFSRDQAHKFYVQGLILRRKAFISNALMRQGGYLFISGSAKRMPSDVLDAVKECIAHTEGITEDEAGKLVARLERTKHIVIEAWS